MMLWAIRLLRQSMLSRFDDAMLARQVVTYAASVQAQIQGHIMAVHVLFPRFFRVT